MLRIALIQLDIAWENRAENHRRADRRIREAAANGARLVILPEMFPCGFSLGASTAGLCEPEGGPTEAWMVEVATGMDLWILAGVPQQSKNGAENRALLVSPKGEVQRYTKLHPFSFAGEQEHFAGGTTVTSWLVEGVRVTPFICYDLRFPEVFRQTVDQTDLYVVIANWPDRRRAHWQALLTARAIENQAYVAGVNRAGDGGGLHYTGDSALISPWGERIVAGAEQEVVLVADVDAGAVGTARAQFPVLKDRR